MTIQKSLTRASLKTPKAAAVAGIIFSTLLIGIFWLFRLSVPADPKAPGVWLYADRPSVGLALNLVPFAGIAFLWFIGVLRDRLGDLEDKFFATVFFGSGILFLALFFSAAGVIGALIITSEVASQNLEHAAILHFGRAIAFTVVNIYLMKMSAVFTLTTSMIALRTGLTSQWTAFLGVGCAVILAFFGGLLDGMLLIFPLWTLVLNLNLLYLQRRQQQVEPPA